MPRIQPTDPERAHGRTRRLLEKVREERGAVPNGHRTLAVSPAALEAFLAAHHALATGELAVHERHLVEVQVSEANASPYCLAAHVATARAAGLGDEAIDDARRGRSPNKRLDALFSFVRAVVQRQGCVEDWDYQHVSAAGFSPAEIAEVVGVIANTIHVNYFHLLAQTELDYPEVKPLETRQDK